jgi:hypothetical protein
VLLAFLRPVLVNRAGEEENHNHRRRDPYGPVEIWVPFEHVEEVGARVERCCAAAQDFGGVDVKGLRVEVEGPEVVFAACGRGAGGRGAGEEGRGGGVGLDFGGAAAGWLGVEVYGGGR